jgi:hypothetical protein
MILYLKTESENELIELLEPYGFREDDTWATISFVGDKRCDIDIIGAIYKKVGTEELDGLQIPVMEQLPGFHANMIWPDDVTVPDDISSATIEAPKTPHRIFA